MKDIHAQLELVVDARLAHGEGPAWSAREGVLYWVDIVGAAVHVFDPASGRDHAIPTGETIGAVAPRRAGGVIVALKSGFALLDAETGSVTPICDPEANLPDNRFNDGKCDPAGRFWAGTCSDNCDVPGAGSLYCLFPDHTVHKALDNLTISNGLAWSPDRKTMYFIDTPTFEVWAFHYDNETGSIANGRTAVTVPQEVGYLDGMTIDAEGMLWVAHWGGACVCRWDPHTGKRLQTIQLPVTQVSSCVFGGPDLNDLYISTSRLGLDEDALKKQPVAGGLFRIRPGVRGTETFEFAG